VRLSMVVVVADEQSVCLLTMSKSSIGICRRSIWTSLSTLHIPRIPFWHNSVRVIPGTIPAEFECHSKFRRNFFINLAGPSAKIDSSGILGIARIPPDSGRNQWGTVKTLLGGEEGKEVPDC
jgi:hypothetical protein